MKIRTGARTFLNVIARACKLSHIPGFRGGLNQILSVEVTDRFYMVWTPFCAFVDTLVEADNWYNKKDHTDDDAGGEDVEPEG